MIKFDGLSKEEIVQIINIIPKNLLVEYVRQNPKDFNKLKPGFRPQALSENQVRELIILGIQKGTGFIVSFVEKYFKQRLEEIEDAHKENAKNHDEETAWILTAKDSVFYERMDVYYKITEKEVSEEYLVMLHSAIKALNEYEKTGESLKVENNSIYNELSVLKKDLQKREIESASLMKKYDDLAENNKKTVDENKKFKKSIETLEFQLQKMLEKNSSDKSKHEKDLEKINSKFSLREEALNREIASLKIKEQEARARHDASNERANRELDAAKKDVDELKKENDNLKKEIKELMSKPQMWGVKERRVNFAIGPIGENRKEFEYVLSENLIALGIKSDEQHLLVNYLMTILFSGFPIVIERRCCRAIVECVAASLTGGEFSEFSFAESDTIGSIREKIEHGGRIIYLDNYLGNFNETLLLSVFEDYRDKIIFLSVAYDRTMLFICEEFLSYVRYINFRRQLNTVNLSPEYIVEKFKEKQQSLKTAKTEVPKQMLENILAELGFSDLIISSRVNYILEHKDVHSVLIYEFLPYCVDVLKKNPYGERLEKYLVNDKSGNSQQIRRWFYGE